MKHAAWICLLSTVCLVSAASAQSQHVAHFKSVVGKVSVMRDGGPFLAEAGTLLHVADRLVSAPGASAGIAFKDGTTLTLGPATELLVRDFVFEPREARYAFSVYLAKGAAVYSSGKIGKLAPEAVKVDSPQATVGVRGTSFIIQAD
jgi:hypothetical protein